MMTQGAVNYDKQQLARGSGPGDDAVRARMAQNEKLIADRQAKIKGLEEELQKVRNDLSDEEKQFADKLKDALAVERKALDESATRSGVRTTSARFKRASTSSRPRPGLTTPGRNSRPHSLRCATP